MRDPRGNFALTLPSRTRSSFREAATARTLIVRRGPCLCDVNYATFALGGDLITIQIHTVPDVWKLAIVLAQGAIRVYTVWRDCNGQQDGAIEWTPEGRHCGGTNGSVSLYCDPHRQTSGIARAGIVMEATSVPAQ